MFVKLKNLASILSITFICTTLSACIILPIKWDNPAKDKTKGVVESETTKEELHQLLGPPIITTEEGNVEVFRFYGGELKFFWASMFTAPIAWPTPWAGVETDDMTGYILVAYASDVVKEIAYGSDQGDTSIELTDYTYYVGHRELLSTKTFEEDLYYSGSKRSDDCIIYVLNSRGLPIGRFDLDGELIGVDTGRGYFRKTLKPGNHEFVTQILTHEKLKQHLESQRKSFEFKEYPLERIQNNFSCSSNEKIYIHLVDVDSSWFSQSFKLVVSNSAPEKIHSRHLVLYQVFPPWTNYSKP